MKFILSFDDSLVAPRLDETATSMSQGIAYSAVGNYASGMRAKMAILPSIQTPVTSLIFVAIAGESTAVAYFSSLWRPELRIRQRQHQRAGGNALDDGAACEFWREFHGMYL